VYHEYQHEMDAALLQARARKASLGAFSTVAGWDQFDTARSSVDARLAIIASPHHRVPIQSRATSASASRPAAFTVLHRTPPRFNGPLPTTPVITRAAAVPRAKLPLPVVGCPPLQPTHSQAPSCTTPTSAHAAVIASLLKLLRCDAWQWLH
jgi:hypothetical protein